MYLDRKPPLPRPDCPMGVRDAMSGSLGPEPPAVTRALRAGIRASRLLFPESGGVRVAEIWEPPVVGDPEALAEIRTYLRQVEDATMPAGRGELLSRILVLLSHYRVEQHPAAVEARIADDWAEDLGGYPIWAIEEAARRWRRTRKFKPQICEMIALCDEACADQLKLRDRLRSIVATTESAANPLRSRMAALADGLFRAVPKGPGD